MRDRRNLVGAGGIAILSLGLGAFLSYLVTRGAENKPVVWHALVTVASLGVAGVGFLVIGVALFLFHQAEKHRLKINDFVNKGQDILSDITGQLASLDNATTRHRQWAKEVRAWLSTNMPFYEGHFRNLADSQSYDRTYLWDSR
jgi:hypothetical protein